MNTTHINQGFHDRLSLLIGMEEPFRWAKKVGIPSATFARIWTDRTIPKHEHLCRIADHCHVSLDWLLRGHGDIGLNCSSVMGSTLIPIVEFASCGVSQGWYNEKALNYTIVVPVFLKQDGVFGALTQGHSMMPAGIKEGSVCLVYPNRSPSYGKPTLIRTKSFIKGQEVNLTTIKCLEGESTDCVKLSGWLDPDDSGLQSLFYEERKKSCITMIAPVGNILEHTGVLSAAPFEDQQETLDELLLARCFESLKSHYQTMDSDKFVQIVMIIYKQALKTGKIDLDILMRLDRIFPEN